MASTKKAPSAAELARQLGVTAKTAWLLRRKITHAMARREGELLLAGIVELDEGFLGGKHSGPASRGRRQPHKTMLAIAAEQRPDGGLGRAQLCVIEDASAASLNEAAAATIGAGSLVRTDGCNGYTSLAGTGYGHQARNLATGADIDDWLPWSHIVLSNFKRWTLDAFHGVSPAHLQAYLDEFCYRLNRRGQRHDLFRRILNRCLLYTEPTTYALLTAARAKGMSMPTGISARRLHSTPLCVPVPCPAAACSRTSRHPAERHPVAEPSPTAYRPSDGGHPRLSGSRRSLCRMSPTTETRAPSQAPSRRCQVFGARLMYVQMLWSNWAAGTPSSTARVTLARTVDGRSPCGHRPTRLRVSSGSRAA